ncbi:MAG: lipase maturation factor family protein [Candidatus Limnocylindria bacterium]
MEWLRADDYWLARLLFQRTLGLIYLVAFLVVLHQFRPLLGERGLLPVPRFLATNPFRQAPSLFHLRYSDRLLAAVAWTGIAISAGVVLGLTDALPLPLAMLAWAVLWLLYLSIVNVGQTFYAFGWETLLLEAGFLAIFLGNASVPVPLPLVFIIRWLLFRVEFGAGLIKMRGDPCWRDLTCLDYHHETQPMPNPLSWFFHHLPRRVHRLEVLGNHTAQLVVPFLLFVPQPIASAAAAVIVATQSWLLLSGNFSWLNAITIALALASFHDGLLGAILPIERAVTEPVLWHDALVLLVTGLVLVLSYRPARNLISRRQLMNYSFEPLHLVNTYGAFGSVTRERYEIVIEGTADPVLVPGTEWREYEFKAKPGDVMRRPPQYAPYHLRLDWLMWFAAMDSPAYHEWFVPLLAKLLSGDRATLRLLRADPFPGAPPTFVRARLYLYRFTTPAERRATGAWWSRTLVGEYLRPLALR